MTASESPAVGDIFELLNRWRHLPFYSLETRAAPFFAVFMRDVLRAKFGTEIHETVIPEFPLRVGTLYGLEERKELASRSGREPGENQSYNVDYVAFGKDNNTVYLVELKTDMGSKREAQEKYLCKARDVPFIQLIGGVRESAKASNSKQKYVHLLHQLSLAGFVSKNDALERLYEKSFCKVVPGWTEAIEGLEFEEQACWNTEVVFIQPRKDEEKSDFKYVYLKEVANIVQRHGDLGCLFANYLRQWTKDAGLPDPRTFDRW